MKKMKKSRGLTCNIVRGVPDHNDVAVQRLEGVLGVLAIVGKDSGDLVKNHDVDHDAALSFPLEEVIKPVLGVQGGIPLQVQLWADPPRLAVTKEIEPRPHNQPRQRKKLT